LITEDNPTSAFNQGTPGRFQNTRWSLVLAAREGDGPAASAALDKLCRTYWYPLYAYVRRKGYAVHDAKDLTQGFFARLLARNYLNVADRNKGKFRSFLLASLEHFLAREWTRAHAQKRGGGEPVFSLDEIDSESRYRIEPADELSAQKIYDRRWAMTLLEQAMARLREESVSGGKRDLFEKLESILSGERGEGCYAGVAASLGMSEGAIKVAVHRLRRRYGELVRAEIAQTVATSEEAEEELQYLSALLRE